MKIAVAGTDYVGLSISMLLAQHYEVMALGKGVTKELFGVQSFPR